MWSWKQIIVCIFMCSFLRMYCNISQRLCYCTPGWRRSVERAKKNPLFIFKSTCFGAIQTSESFWRNRYGHLNYASLSELVKHSMVRVSACCVWRARYTDTYTALCEAPTGIGSHGWVWPNGNKPIGGAILAHLLMILPAVCLLAL